MNTNPVVVSSESMRGRLANQFQREYPGEEKKWEAFLATVTDDELDNPALIVRRFEQSLQSAYPADKYNKVKTRPGAPI